MEIDSNFTFDIPQEKVWKVLCEPKVLALIIPICRDVKQVALYEYTGSLFFRAGGIAGIFNGKIELSNVKEPDSYDIVVHGDSPIGVVDVHGDIRLESHEQSTIMHYKGDVQFGGRMISVGSRILENAVNSMMRQSFQTLNQYLIMHNK